MATSNILSLGEISTSGDVTTIGSIMLGDTPIGASVTVAADTAKSITLNADKKHNYGSLVMDKDGNLSLRASAELYGEVSIDSSASDKKLTSVSFASTKGVKTTLDAAELTALKSATFGAGNDTVAVTGYTF